MSQPSFLASGTKPLPSDTKIILWKKILGVYQNRSGAQARNNPLEVDTTRTTLVKILRSLRSGTGPTFSITAPSDTDAFNYWVKWIVGCFTGNGCTVDSSAWSPGGHIVLPVACATVCGATQTGADAVDALVISLKAAGLWTLLDVIYPFMGSTAASCALNLKDPNSFAITWHGGVTFSASGATGNGTTGYGDTGYNPSVNGVNFTLNAAGLGVYINATSQGILAGAYSVIVVGTYIWNSAIGVVGKVNVDITGETSPGIPYQAPTNGNYVVSRTAANLTTLYTPPGLSSTTAVAPNAVTAFSLYLLAVNFSAVPTTFAAATMKFMWAGAGLSGAQVAALGTIITTFETALGRA